MNLEFNLIRVKSSLALSGNLIARRRIVASEDEQITPLISEFLKNNLEIITPAITDLSLVNKLESLGVLSVDDFRWLNYILTSDYGYTIKVFRVSESADNAEGFDSNLMEWNIIDRFDVTNRMIPLSTKITIDQTQFSTGEVYRQIASMYSAFEGSLFDDRGNKLQSLIEAGEQYPMFPEPIANQIENVLNVAGLTTYILYNE